MPMLPTPWVSSRWAYVMTIHCPIIAVVRGRIVGTILLANLGHVLHSTSCIIYPRFFLSCPTLNPSPSSHDESMVPRDQPISLHALTLLTLSPVEMIYFVEKRHFSRALKLRFVHPNGDSLVIGTPGRTAGMMARK